MIALRSWVWRLTFLAVALFLGLSLFRDDISRSVFSSGIKGRPICSLTRSLERSLHLRAPVSYARLHIDVAETAVQTSDKARKTLGIGKPVLKPLQRKWDWHFGLTAATGETCTSSATVEIPRLPSARADASNIRFGVSTDLDRLENSLQAFSHWAGNTGTTMFALVNYEDITDSGIERVVREAANLGMTLDIARQNISGPDSSVGDRYFAMIKHVYERLSDSQYVRQDHAPQWAAFIDDDTFFPSMHGLAALISSYDGSQPHWIGGLSEDVVLLDLIGRMSYGGAGVFLSLPLLSQVYKHWDDCNEHHSPGGGDKRLKECILAHTMSELEVEDGLHQVDLHGDVSGFYEAGRPLPSSIHHWKSWNHVDIVALAAVANVCGDECLLKRYQFHDGWYLANGFSIFKYSDEFDQDAPEGETVMEETWDLGGDYVDRLGPLRPKDPGKESYRLARSIVDGAVVRQFYVKRSDGGDGVVEVEWKRLLAEEI